MRSKKRTVTVLRKFDPTPRPEDDTSAVRGVRLSAMSRCGGIATSVSASDYVRTFRGAGVEPDLVALPVGGQRFKCFAAIAFAGRIATLAHSWQAGFSNLVAGRSLDESAGRSAPLPARASLIEARVAARRWGQSGGFPPRLRPCNCSMVVSPSRD